MNINKNRLKKGIWYEDADGNYIPHGDSVDPPDNAMSYHCMFPLELREEIQFRQDSKEGFGGKMVFTTNIGGGNADVILAMANSGDYTLGEAFVIFGRSCERCMNVLAYKYLNGKDGYEEYSEEWKKCGTVCDFCRDMGHTNRG